MNEQELRGEALEEIRRKVGCLYSWMLIITALILVGFSVVCVLAALNWGALLWEWP